MAERRKNGKRKNEEEDGALQMVSSEALRGVFAILFVAFAGFLILAGIGVGGVAGALLYETLSWVLGVGYMLLPLSLILVAVLIFRSLERSVGWIPLVAMAIFLLSSLGLIDIAFPSSAGILGAAVADPMVGAIDTIATVVFLAAFIVAALIIAFDINLGALWERLRALASAESQPMDASIDDVPVVGLPEDESEEESESEPEAEKETSVRTFESREAKSSEEGFPIIAATASTYTPPPASLLSKNKGKPEVGDVKANMNIIKRTLQNFGINVEMDEASIGPTVTRYAMKPAEGVRLSKIVALLSNLELALAASPVRIEAPTSPRPPAAPPPPEPGEGFGGEKNPFFVSPPPFFTGKGGHFEPGRAL